MFKHKWQTHPSFFWCVVCVFFTFSLFCQCEGEVFLTFGRMIEILFSVFTSETMTPKFLAVFKSLSEFTLRYASKRFKLFSVNVPWYGGLSSPKGWKTYFGLKCSGYHWAAALICSYFQQVLLPPVDYLLLHIILPVCKLTLF